MSEVRHIPLRLVTQTAADWAAARDLRLEMLADTPTAFLEPLADALSLTDEAWQARHERRCADRASHGVALVDATDRWVGQAWGVIDRFGDLASVVLAAVYLSPSHRGGRAAEQLVGAVEQWAVTQHITEMKLEVTDDNDRAIAFYRRLGYQFTGRERPYPLDARLRDLEMVKHVDLSAAR